MILMSLLYYQNDNVHKGAVSISRLFSTIVLVTIHY